VKYSNDKRRNKVIRHWAENNKQLIIEYGLDIGDHCWACGYDDNLNICHIKPKMLGGDENPDNLVILCRDCHNEAPTSGGVHGMLLFTQFKPSSIVYDLYDGIIHRCNFHNIDINDFMAFADKIKRGEHKIESYHSHGATRTSRMINTIISHYLEVNNG